MYFAGIITGGHTGKNASLPQQIGTMCEEKYKKKVSF